MAKATKTYKDIMKLAESCGVGDNAMFIAAAKQYELQQLVISSIRSELESGELLTSKEYVKGRENVYANPLVKELPKISDSANRTLTTMLDIVERFGHAPREKSKLEMLME